MYVIEKYHPDSGAITVKYATGQGVTLVIPSDALGNLLTGVALDAFIVKHAPISRASVIANAHVIEGMVTKSAPSSAAVSIPPHALLARLTASEFSAISMTSVQQASAGNPTVLMMLWRMMSASELNLSDPAVIADINSLVSAGLILPGRVAELTARYHG